VSRPAQRRPTLIGMDARLRTLVPTALVVVAIAAVPVSGLVGRLGLSAPSL